MLTLTLPVASNTNYPTARFGRLNDLRRHADFNANAFREYVATNTFNLQNEHLLVGLLQHLAIDPEWDLKQVVEYTRFRSYQLCTLFKITSMNLPGDVILDGLYRGGVGEYWVLMEDNETYEGLESLDQVDLDPVVPLWTSFVEFSYTHTLKRKVVNVVPPFEYAIIGLNLVKLAVGWWLFMKDPRNDGTGIHNYVCKAPLTNALLISNQYMIQKAVYQHLLHGDKLEDLVKYDQVTFITTSEKKVMVEYLEFLVEYLKGHRMQRVEQIMQRFDGLYKGDWFNYQSEGKGALFSQTCWAFEPRAIQLMAIHLVLGNLNHYRCGDITSSIDRAQAGMFRNYVRLREKNFTGILQKNLDALVRLNKQNIHGV